MNAAQIYKGQTSILYVLPSASLRALVLRRAERLLPGANYAMQWKDVNGYGIEIAVADWLPSGYFYGRR